MSLIRLLRDEIKDTYIRDNFRRLQDFLNVDPLRKGQFKFYEIVLKTAAVNAVYPHRLGFLPFDVLHLSVRLPDTATVTWHYDKFDEINLVFSTSGGCTIRAYIGRYGEGL